MNSTDVDIWRWFVVSLYNVISVLKSLNSCYHIGKVVVSKCLVFEPTGRAVNAGGAAEGVGLGALRRRLE